MNDFVGEQATIEIRNLGFDIVFQKYIVEDNYFSAWNNESEYYKLNFRSADGTGILDYSFLVPHAQKILYDDQSGKLEFSKDLEGDMIGFLPIHFSNQLLQNVFGQKQKKD